MEESHPRAVGVEGRAEGANNVRNGKAASVWQMAAKSRGGKEGGDGEEGGGSAP